MYVCYVMLCYVIVMLCYDKLYYLMLCYVIKYDMDGVIQSGLTHNRNFAKDNFSIEDIS